MNKSRSKYFLLILLCFLVGIVFIIARSLDPKRTDKITSKDKTNEKIDAPGEKSWREFYILYNENCLSVPEKDIIKHKLVSLEPFFDLRNPNSIVSRYNITPTLFAMLNPNWMQIPPMIYEGVEVEIDVVNGPFNIVYDVGKNNLNVMLGDNICSTRPIKETIHNNTDMLSSKNEKYIVHGNLTSLENPDEQGIYELPLKFDKTKNFVHQESNEISICVVSETCTLERFVKRAKQYGICLIVDEVTYKLFICVLTEHQSYMTIQNESGN